MYPVKSGKTVVLPRYFNYLVVHCGDDVFIARRDGKDIWRNLYEFVLIESDKELTFEALQHNDFYRKIFGDTAVRITTPPFSHRHILSHRIIYATFHTIEVDMLPDGLFSYVRVPYREVGRYAFSRLTGLYFDWLEKSSKNPTLEVFG